MNLHIPTFIRLDLPTRIFLLSVFMIFLVDSCVQRNRVRELKSEVRQCQEENTSLQDDVAFWSKTARFYMDKAASCERDDTVVEF